MKKLFVVFVFAALVCADAYADKTNFKWVKDVKYEQVRHFSNSLSAFRQDGKWGFMNGKGQVAIAPVYEECRDFSNGYAAVKQNGLWGYVDKLGTVVIPPHFDEAMDFNQHRVAIVRKNGKYGVISTKGTSLAGIMFDEIGAYSDGFALAKSGDVQYYIDYLGAVHNLPKNYMIGNFSDGMAPIQNLKTGKWGFVDKKGGQAIDPKYDTVYSFSNGIALVKFKGEYQHINKAGGKKKIDAAAGQSLEFVNDFAKIKTARGIGFIGKNLKMLPHFGKDASNFNQDGLAAIETEDNELAYINKSGKIAFKVAYDRIGNFNNGLAWVCKNDKYGYINTKGELVIDTLFTSATDFRDSLAYVSTKDRFGCIRYTPGYAMPKVDFAGVELKDENEDGKVQAAEEFDIRVTLRNPGPEDLEDVHVRYANQVDQESWFTYDEADARIPILKAYSDTVITFKAKSDLSILSSDVAMRFVGTSANTLGQNEHTWQFETVGIQASKPVMTRYWIYEDDHTPINGGALNLLMTLKNDGKDPAKDVNVDFQLPEGSWTNEPQITIPQLNPGETRDVRIVFQTEDDMDPEQTIVARISDITQQHNKVEYLTYTMGRVNSEVRLDGTAPVFNMTQNTSNAGALAGAQMVSQSEGVGKESFVSDLLVDIQRIATPDKNKYALIFGNEDYNIHNYGTVAQANVDYAQADAEAFRLYAINYMGVPEDHIVMNINALRTQMRRGVNTIKEWVKIADGNAEVYVFYAGHGQPDEATGDTYLIPVDVLLTEASEGYKLDDFYSQIASINARKKIIFLDACYTGVGRAGWAELVTDGPSIDGNMLVFTATNSAQKSMPYAEKRHGMFTYYLLSTIKEANGQISVNDLFLQTKDKVHHSSININNSMQTPELLSGDGIERNWKKWMLH